MKIVHKTRLYFLLYSLLLFISKQGISQDGSSALAEELKQLYDINNLPSYRTGSKVGLISTYDTTGGNDDGFSGKYSFVRKEGEYLVLADLKGPGVIQRIHTPTPTEKMIAFYFGGEEKPRVRMPFIELFSGKHFPFIAPVVGNEVGGYFSYIPIPFNRSLKIVYEGQDIRFHQIQYRIYGSQENIKSFDTVLTPTEKSGLDKLVKSLNSVGAQPWKEIGGAPVKMYEKRFSVGAGNVAELFRNDQPGRIVGIEIDRDFTQWGSKVLLEAYWDGEQKPAILAPANDFFGYSFGKPAAQGKYLGSFSGKDYCYFPMPWDKKAIIRLRAVKDLPRTVTGTVRIYYTTAKRSEKTEGKFYSSWRREIEPAEGVPYLISHVRGKGHHVATLLQSQGLVPGTTEFFEGDDVVTIDKERELHGGGSEDYFNGGWYWILDRWDKGISLPLHGSLDYSLANSRTGGYRFFLADKLSFEKELHFTIEHGPEGNKSPVDYTSVAFYYGNAPSLSAMDPALVQKPVKVPVLHEYFPRDFSMMIGPGTKVHSTGYNTPIEISGLIPTKGWVVDDAERGEARGQVTIDLSNLESKKYKVYITYVESENGGSFSMWRRQQPICDWIDTYSDTVKNKEKVYIGDIQLTDQIKTITMRTIGKNGRETIKIRRLLFEEITD